MNNILWGVLARCALLIILSLLQIHIPPPGKWLTEWTGWAASVVAIVVSARVLWVGGDALRKYANRT